MTDATSEITPEDAPPELPRGDLVDSADNPLTDIAAERLLLGFLLTDPAAIDRVVPEIGEGDFFDPMHRRVYGVFLKGREEGWAVDTKVIAETLGLDWNGTMPGTGLTTGGYFARLITDADMSVDPAEVAAWIQECSERRAIGAVDDEEWQANTPFISKMGLKMWADQNEPTQEYDYIVEDLIPEGEACLTMGDSGTGKSFLMSHLALCGARAVPFFGRRIQERFGTIWFAYEAGHGQTARMRAYARYHGLEVSDLPFAVLTKPQRLWPDPKAFEHTVEEIRGIVRTRFGGVPLKLCIFDTYNAATPGASEIDSEVVSKIRLGFDYIRDQLPGVSTLIVGHTNAAGKHRGNDQLTNNIDTVILVSRKTMNVGREVFPKKDDDGREVRTMKVKKQREGQDGEETDFILRVVEDGTTNKFGKQRTSCVVAAPNYEMSGADQADARPSSRDNGDGFRASKNEILFMECLLATLDEHGVEPPPELGLPRSVSRVADYDSVKRLMANKMLSEEDSTPEGQKRHRERVKKAVGRARENLSHWKVVVGNAEKNVIWWTGKPVRGVKATQPKSRDLFDNQGPAPSDDDGDLTEFY